jgi:protein translocase SecG subunit
MRAASVNLRSRSLAARGYRQRGSAARSLLRLTPPPSHVLLGVIIQRLYGSMRTFLGVVELILALLVMLGILLQTPKASGLGGTIGGGGDSGGGYRTKRGLEKNLFYATIGLVVMFVAVSIVYIRV